MINMKGILDLIFTHNFAVMINECFVQDRVVSVSHVRRRAVFKSKHIQLNFDLPTLMFARVRIQHQCLLFPSHWHSAQQIETPSYEIFGLSVIAG